MIYLWIVIAFGMLVLAAHVVMYLQTIWRLRDLQRIDKNDRLEWNEFIALATRGEGSLIVSHLGGGRPVHFWHPKKKLLEHEIDDICVNEIEIKPKIVFPPIWCHDLCLVLRWMFPRIDVIHRNVAGFP